jgi:hypothetical protein
LMMQVFQLLTKEKERNFHTKKKCSFSVDTKKRSHNQSTKRRI